MHYESDRPVPRCTASLLLDRDTRDIYDHPGFDGAVSAINEIGSQGARIQRTYHEKVYAVQVITTPYEAGQKGLIGLRDLPPILGFSEDEIPAM